MQDPTRNRPQDDLGRDDHDDGRWAARDRGRDERPSWTEGDGGRTADAYRNQGQPERQTAGSRGMGYDQDQQNRYGEGMSTGWTGDRSPGAWGSQTGPSYGYQTYDQNHGQPGRGFPEQGSFARPGPYSYGGGMSGDRPIHGYSQNYGQAGPTWSRHAYAPGSQIWEGPGREMESRAPSAQSQHDFEPDYLHWREQQLSSFDKDYSDWRSERRQKFSSDFDAWRQNRPRTDASGHTLAENPIVGDIADGGDGRGGEQAARKR